MKNEILEKLNGKKILIATLPAEGHLNPLTGIAKYLQEAGCDVRWYTSVIFRDKLQRLGVFHYPFIQALDVNSNNMDELFPERKNIADAGERANFDMTNGLCKPTPGMLADIELIQQNFPFDIVIADNLFPAIPLIKAKLNVPVISIGVIPLAEQSKDLAPYGPGFYPPENDEQYKAYTELTQVFNNVIFKGLIDAYSAILTENNIPHERAPVTDTLIRHASLHLQIGTPSFEFKRSDLGNNIRFIGALLPYSNAKHKQKWFDERLNQYKKIVLVTQGTVEKDTTKILEPTLNAFKNTDTLVIATTGGSKTAELKEKYPFNNIIIDDFIPFDDVMPYASVYVTNGGYGGTLLSIMNNLPIVAAGVHEGKSEICSRLGYFKYGIDLKTETPTTEAIKEGVEKVLSDNLYKQNMTRLANEIKEYDSIALVAGYVAELIAEKETQAKA
ncbi:MAG: glycosyltransferase [Mucilaginibacter sp.]|uniref:glycosyltransferase n=1 Tax=Mucilaginibacter sp. TaxID=1882438 RepID=UPI0031A84CB9